MQASVNGSPWLSRPEWASGRIPSARGAGLVIRWIFAIVAGGITAAYLGGYGLFSNPGKVVQEHSYLILIPFVLVSLGLLASALARTWTAIRSGPSTLELSTIPGIIGGRLEGVIHGGPVLRAGQGVRLILRCVATSWSRSGSGKSTSSTSCRWEDDREISPAAIVGVIPVRFDIPPDALASAHDERTEDGSLTVSWILEALGEPGNFWRAEYEVPVFRTAAAPAEARPELESVRKKVDDLLRGTAFVEKAPEKIERPASSRVSVQATDKGLEIIYPCRTAFLVATTWVIATLPLYVAPLVIERWWPAWTDSVSLSGGLAAGLVFNALPAFLLILAEPRRVLVGAREIVVTTGWPIFGGARRFDLEEFDGVQADPQFFSVLRKNAPFLRRRFFLATKLESHAESRWLASEVDRAVRARFPAGGAVTHS